MSRRRRKYTFPLDEALVPRVHRILTSLSCREEMVVRALRLSASEVRHGVTISSEMVGENPNFQDPTPGSWHWKVKLQRRRPRRQLTTFFTMGPALNREPGVEEVLDCLCSDASTVDNARSFEDWCSDLGYDTDSRKAEKTFKAVETQTGRLKAFLGDEYEAALEAERRL